MKHIIITEKNSIMRMLAREAIRPYMWLAIAGVCFTSVILSIPSLIWGDSAWTAEELQKILLDFYQFGVRPTIPRYYYVDSLYTFLISGPLSFGLISFLMNIFRRRETRTLDIFLGFANFWKTFLFYVLTMILTVLGSILFVIPGLVVVYSYAMGYYLMNDDPELNAIQAMRLSRQLMRGNRWKLFTLHISFIGWAFLVGIVYFTLSRLSLWIGVLANVILSSLLTAYFRMSEVAFYEMLVGHLHRLDPEEVKANVNN